MVERPTLVTPTASRRAPTPSAHSSQLSAHLRSFAHVTTARTHKTLQTARVGTRSKGRWSTLRLLRKPKPVCALARHPQTLNARCQGTKMMITKETKIR